MFAIAGGLAVFGSMMVYSASAMMAMKESSESSQYTYFLKQLMFVVIGIVLMYIVSRFDYRILNNKTAVTSILVVTSIALAAVLFFPEINGAKRWIRFSGVSFQPSELAKVALPIFLAWYLAKHEATVTELKTTVLRSVAGLVLLGGLVMLEKDLGTTIVLCLIFSAIYFAAGARMVHIAAVAGVMILAAVGAIAIAPWRVQRVLAFLDPYKYADDESYQVIQSLYAIGSGGILGEGFAKGQQKLFYLPYPYSDFIFSVVGEEFGLLGTLAIVTTFGLLLWRGTKAALNAPDRFGMLLGIGLITGIIAQALFNISVVISIMPAKGIPLPFISYGGSSVVVTLIAVGILLSISKFSDETVTTDVVARPRASGRRTRNA
ncbi:MAG: putative lipid II flippase FtsW [Pyrinomonadaceae bacterium]|nr:putative lipid II flippase FtsW [Chloracidobacterium sp.]MBP9108623.1 putative lipid II flippase FtsW [Pyrinomonadaceae bacterium]